MSKMKKMCRTGEKSEKSSSRSTVLACVGYPTDLLQKSAAKSGARPATLCHYVPCWGASDKSTRAFFQLLFSAIPSFMNAATFQVSLCDISSSSGYDN